MSANSKSHEFKKEIPRLFLFISHHVENPDDAWDILQETLISANYSLPSYGGQSSFFAWISGIAKHEIADFYRKKKIKTILFSHLPFLEELASQALGPEEEAIEEELKERIRQTLATVSEGYSLVLRLKYIDGNSVSEIAEKLKLSYKAVESRLSRARVAFQKAWISENAKSEKSRPKEFF